MEIGRRLSALELTALGVILKRGPCLAHAVVREFAGSQTSAYRSGAGSIYPLLKRLTGAGLLKVVQKKYTLTEAGMGALREWLRPPFPDGDFSTSLDVLRSRAYFLRLLTPLEIVEFVDYSRVELEKLLGECRETWRHYIEAGDPFSEMAMLGAIKETEARLAWLGELRERFG